jgi:hypothetical protein
MCLEYRTIAELTEARVVGAAVRCNLWGPSATSLIPNMTSSGLTDLASFSPQLKAINSWRAGVVGPTSVEGAEACRLIG